MSDHVTNYISAAEKLAAAFKCGAEFPFRLCLGEKWRLNEADGSFFLSLENGGGKADVFVAVKANGKPLRYRYGRYIMVVAIDCVKTAFILDDKNEING